MTETETETPAAETAVAPAPAPTPAAVTTDASAIAAPAAPVTMPALPDGPVRTVGRRKKSTARVHLAVGDGKVTVNGRTLDAYFPDERERIAATRALHVVHSSKRFDVTVKVSGGGHVGQSGAMALGIARALVACDPAIVPVLRGAGLLTRDARIKERKKYGRRGARRGFQFSKR